MVLSVEGACIIIWIRIPHNRRPDSETACVACKGAVCIQNACVYGNIVYKNCCDTDVLICAFAPRANDADALMVCRLSVPRVLFVWLFVLHFMLSNGEYSVSLCVSASVSFLVHWYPMFIFFRPFFLLFQLRSNPTPAQEFLLYDGLTFSICRNLRSLVEATFSLLCMSLAE